MNDPLPPTYERDLRRIDDLLASNLAGRRQTPLGLTQRICVASCHLLPGRSALAMESGDVGRLGWIGRIALAAALALSFTLAGRLLTPPPAAPPAEVEWLFTMGRTSDGWPELSALIDSSEVLGHEFGYILETRNLSIGNMAGELAELEAALGM